MGIWHNRLVNGLVAVLISGLVGVLSWRADQRAAEAEVLGASELLSEEVEDLGALARTLALSSSVRAFEEGEAEDLRGDFQALLSNEPSLLQARILSVEGLELLRVHRVDGQVVSVSEEALQVKADRYYVKDARTLVLGELYLSRLDLNEERGVVQDPPTPVLRVLTPTPGGRLLALNQDGTSLLARLACCSVLVGQDEVRRPAARVEVAGRVLTLAAGPRPLLPVLGPPLGTLFVLLPLAGLLSRQQARRRHVERGLHRLNGLLLAAHDEERRRVARWLHDQLSQDLTAARLQVLRAEGLTGERQLEALARASETLDALMGRVHELAHRLRTPLLDDLGLEEALHELGRRAEARVELGSLKEVSRPVAEQAYRIAEEALRNATNHAHAADLELRASVEAGRLVLVVRDDGRGLDGTHAGLGLLGMRERAELVGGALQLDSAPGAGTTVRALLPLESV